MIHTSSVHALLISFLAYLPMWYISDNRRKALAGGAVWFVGVAVGYVLGLGY